MNKAQAYAQYNQDHVGTDHRSERFKQALAVGLELARNTVRCRTLDEVHFVLVNDTRALLPFDRSFLIEHFEDNSQLAAIANQPTIEVKSELTQATMEMAPSLKSVDKALVFLKNSVIPQDIPSEASTALTKYFEHSQTTALLVAPLLVQEKPVAHLIMEFFGADIPGEIETLALMNMLPFLAASLSEKWFLAHNKKAAEAFREVIFGKKPADEHFDRMLKTAVPVVVILAVLLIMCIPVTLTIGGRAEVVPGKEYLAYAQMDGVISDVQTAEGRSVKRGEVVARLDSKEIDYKIREASRLVQSYRAETEILRNMGAENSQKLAQSTLTTIKGLRAEQTLEFLNYQRQYVDIRSPIDGVVLTKRLESLIGKKLKAGEAFCRIARPRELITEIFVKESDAEYIARGETAEVFLNSNPDKAYSLKVDSIAPKAETAERMGAVFRVRADFGEQPTDLMPGMLGIAHIYAKKASLWFVLTRRIKIKISELLLYL